MHLHLTKMDNARSASAPTPIDALSLLKDFICLPDASPNVVTVDSTRVEAVVENGLTLCGSGSRPPIDATTKKRSMQGESSTQALKKRRTSWDVKDKECIIEAFHDGGRKNMLRVAKSLKMSASVADKVLFRYNHSGADTLFDKRHNTGVPHKKKIDTALQNVLLDLIHEDCTSTLEELRKKLNCEIMRGILLKHYPDVYLPAEERLPLGPLRSVDDYKPKFPSDSAFKAVSSTKSLFPLDSS